MDDEIETLNKRIEEEQKKHASSEMADNDPRQGMKAGIEFVVAITVPTFIGFKLDQWLDTKPAFFFLLMFMGMITGFYNVYRISKNLGTAVGNSRLQSEKKNDKTIQN